MVFPPIQPGRVQSLVELRGVGGVVGCEVEQGCRGLLGNELVVVGVCGCRVGLWIEQQRVGKF